MTVKQLWIFNHYAQGPEEPGGGRHHALASHLGQLGWQVHLIASSVSYLSLHQRLDSGELHRLETLNGVPFLWLRTPAWHGYGLARLASMAVYTVQALRKNLLRWLPRPDVVVGSSVHPFAAWVGAVWARRLGVPYVYEVRDLWPLTLLEMGKMRQGAMAERLFTWLENNCARRADLVVSVLDGAGEYFSRYGVGVDRFLHLPNGVEVSSFDATPVAPKNHAFTLMYLGAHGQANGLDLLLDSMSRLQERKPNLPVKLRLIGDGSYKSELQGQADSLGLKNVVFEAAVGKDKIPELASQADAFVLMVRNLPGLYRYGFSMNKMYDYLSAGRPVILSSPACNNPVELAGAGLRVPAGDPDALAQAIERMAEMPVAARQAMGQAGRTLMESEYDFRVLAERLALALDRIVWSRDCRANVGKKG